METPYVPRTPRTLVEVPLVSLVPSYHHTPRTPRTIIPLVPLVPSYQHTLVAYRITRSQYQTCHALRIAHTQGLVLYNSLQLPGRGNYPLKGSYRKMRHRVLNRVDDRRTSLDRPIVWYFRAVTTEANGLGVRHEWIDPGEIYGIDGGGGCASGKVCDVTGGGNAGD